MNIVVEQTDDICIMGLAAAMTGAGFNVDLWNESKPFFDMVAEKQPNYILLNGTKLTKEKIEGIKEFNLNVIIHGINVPDFIADNIKLVLVPEDIPKTIADGISGNKLILHQAANLAQYRKGHYIESIAADIGHITAYRSIPNKQIIRQIGSLLPTLDYKFKVCGPIKMPCPQYVGTITQRDIVHFFKSVDIYIDYDNTFMLECAANQVFVITNKPNPLYPWFDNDTKLVELIKDFKNNEKARRKITKKAYNYVVNEHTYFHRIIEIGRALGETTWEAVAQTAYTKFRD